MNRRKAKKHYITKYRYKHYKEIKQIPYCDINNTKKWDEIKKTEPEQIIKEIKEMWYRK